MTLEQLRQFVTVAEKRSINKAADEIFISQSALSRSMKLLEHELGQALFRRTNQGVYLTPFGQSFYDHAQNLCVEYEILKNMSLPNTNYAKNDLRVSTHDLSFVDYIFFEVYNRNKSKNPSFSIIKQDISTSIFEVRNGLADIGITFKTRVSLPAIKNMIESNNLVFHQVTELPLAVYVGYDHPLAKKGRQTVTPKELLQYPFVATEGNFEINELLTILETDRLFRHSITVNFRDTMVDCLNATDGFTFAPDPKCYKEIPSPGGPGSKRIHVMELSGPPYLFVLAYFYKKGDVLSDSCKEFIEALVGLF